MNLYLKGTNLSDLMVLTKFSQGAPEGGFWIAIPPKKSLIPHPAKIADPAIPPKKSAHSAIPPKKIAYPTIQPSPSGAPTYVSKKGFCFIL